eukprot:TRINITY_DN40398_c0_g1_i1.p1 TRINITY_DN40398_c0_g1~~TRINITY_DN40398_c0_g1_i1.p1  ORF type:complete len:220 (-),score=26.39 TRINITY_DN40398_c0_g1_i1:126-785(-)
MGSLFSKANVGQDLLGSYDKAEEFYDKWASTYDAQLQSWDYQAPSRVAKLCVEHGLPQDGPVLDCGCGTGLSGAALRDIGIKNDLFGCDISQKSLDLVASSKKGLYAALQVANLETLPLPYSDESVVGVTCVGVLSYVSNFEDIFRDWIRVTRKGGLVIYTHREDLIQKDSSLQAKSNLEKEGLWEQVYMSQPESYLPNANDAEASEFLIRTIVMRRPA